MPCPLRRRRPNTLNAVGPSDYKTGKRYRVVKAGAYLTGLNSWRDDDWCFPLDVDDEVTFVRLHWSHFDTGSIFSLQFEKAGVEGPPLLMTVGPTHREYLVGAWPEEGYLEPVM